MANSIAARAGRSHASLGFLRVAVVTPELRLADPAANAGFTIAAIAEAAAAGASLVLFPELGLTGYSCADLFDQAALREGAIEALGEIAAATKGQGIAAVVGLPIEVAGRLYNCAAVVAEGELLGLVPKTFLPTTGEFYEARWFSSGGHATPTIVRLAGRDIPFGTDLLFEPRGLPAARFGIELCEDLWSVEPPSGDLALAGATLILNLSASDELVGKADYRRSLVTGASARCLAAYAYAAAGPWESTTDVVYSGDSMIAENGTLLASTPRFSFATQMAIADVDVARLVHERLRSSSFASASPGRAYRAIEVPMVAALEAHADLRRVVSPTPFVPADPAAREASCREIFTICATALARRLRHTGSRTIVLGLSGGLDSTLALLIAKRAFDQAGLDPAAIEAVSLPGLGTSARTRANASALAAAFGVSFREIPIGPAVRAHFADIGQDEAVHDLTYENAQARERTQILMDLASRLGGFVVGTGDLSEAALGWATFNGDHMSMYHVNAGIPKTLVRDLVAWAAETAAAEEALDGLRDILRDVLATPVSPELLPNEGRVAQETEAAIGPYRLHDFFLYHAIRGGASPARVIRLAEAAFAGEFERTAIVACLRVFYRRFFAAQFKRSAMPDGPKVGTVALSPRGDWRMPSDAAATLFLAELDGLD